MAFGIQNVPATFQHLINNVLFGIPNREFGRATATYLGKEVGQGQERPVAAKVQAIVDFLVLTTSFAIFWGWQDITEGSVKISLLL